MKINLNNNDKDRVKVNNNIISFKFNLRESIDRKIKVEYNIKLELHLRNSEVVGIPIINTHDPNSVFNRGLKLISHSIYKPLRGTHDKVYLTFDTSNLVWSECAPFIDSSEVQFIFVSKLYWEMLCKKCIDGIQSVPVEIIEIP